MHQLVKGYQPTGQESSPRLPDSNLGRPIWGLPLLMALSSAGGHAQTLTRMAAPLTVMFNTRASMNDTATLVW